MNIARLEVGIGVTRKMDPVIAVRGKIASFESPSSTLGYTKTASERVVEVAVCETGVSLEGATYRVETVFRDLTAFKLALRTIDAAHTILKAVVDRTAGQLWVGLGSHGHPAPFTVEDLKHDSRQNERGVKSDNKPLTRAITSPSQER